MELGPEERRSLAAFAEVYTPSTADARAALARVRARIDRGDVVDEGEAAEPTASRSGRWIAIGAAAIAIAAAAVLAVQFDVGSMLAREVEGDGDPEAAYAQPDDASGGGEAIDRAPDRGAATRRDADGGDGAEPEAAPEPAPKVATDPNAASKGKRARPHGAGKRSADATLHAEMALLRPAEQALRSGNHRRALQLFDDHARSFPDSALAEERALGRIEALCGLGRGDEARKAAASFGRRFPGSPYRAKAQRACPEPEAPP